MCSTTDVHQTINHLWHCSCSPTWFCIVAVCWCYCVMGLGCPAWVHARRTLTSYLPTVVLGNSWDGTYAISCLMWCHFKLCLWFLLLFSFLFYSPLLHCLLSSFCLSSSYLLLYALKTFHLVTTLAPVDVTQGWSFQLWQPQSLDILNVLGVVTCWVWIWWHFELLWSRDEHK